MRKKVLLVKAGGELYLVETAKLDQSKMEKGMEYYDGKGNIRIWGTGHVYDLSSKRIVATPDQIGITTEESLQGVTTRDMIETDFNIILERRQGECSVEVEATPYPDGTPRPTYYQHKVLIHI